MHWRAHSIDMNSKAIYSDVVEEVKAELMDQVGKAIAAGIEKEKIILDPGIGFAKESDHNWDLIHRITEIVDLGYPVLVGASRKRFLGGDLPLDREAATLKITEDLLDTGIWGVRVHSVAPHKEVIAGV
jgi:dihydropteroate synthase